MQAEWTPTGGRPTLIIELLILNSLLYFSCCSWCSRDCSNNSTFQSSDTDNLNFCSEKCFAAHRRDVYRKSDKKSTSGLVNSSTKKSFIKPRLTVKPDHMLKISSKERHHQQSLRHVLYQQRRANRLLKKCQTLLPPPPPLTTANKQQQQQQQQQSSPPAPAAPSLLPMLPPPTMMLPLPMFIPIPIPIPIPVPVPMDNKNNSSDSSGPSNNSEIQSIKQEPLENSEEVRQTNNDKSNKVPLSIPKPNNNIVLALPFR